MNKKINIEKKIDFEKDIKEITAISLEHDLSFTNENSINGNLIVSGKYKTPLLAQFDEEFNYKIPVDISLTDSLDVDNSKTDITDFNYEIVEVKSLLCKIELLIDGKVISDVRECDGDSIDTKEFELPKIDDKLVEDVEVLEENNEIMVDESEEIDEEENNDDDDIDNNNDLEQGDDNSLFNIDNNETYGTFIVYIVRQNETINSILSKYNTTIEEIEKYNDIKDLSIGTKLVIPLLKDENK